MTATEFGVRYAGKTEPGFVAGGFTEDGARQVVAAAAGAKAKDCDPRPVEVMRREVGDWASVSAEVVA